MEDLSCRRYLCISTKVPQEVNDDLKPSLLGRTRAAKRAGTHRSFLLTEHAYDLQIFFLWLTRFVASESPLRRQLIEVKAEGKRLLRFLH